MAFEALANLGSGVSGVGSGLTSLGTFGEQLFGTTKTQKETGTTRGTVTEQLEIDEEGVQKILKDILGGTEGLASIFSEEQVAGIFGGSVSAQASGDLIASLAGEIAKLTAKKTQTTDQTTTAKATGGSGGLLKQIF